MKEGFGESGGKRYLQIKNGQIAMRCDKNTPGAVPVEKKDGSTFYEVHYPNLTGRLTGLGVKEHEQYGKFLVITMRVKDQDFQLETYLNGGYAQGFLMTLPNAKLEDLMMISPSYEEKDGHKRSNMFIQQEPSDDFPTGWLKRFWTKDNPGNLPELVQIKVKGKMVWDDSLRLEFFEAMIPKIDAKLKDLQGANLQQCESEPEPVSAAAKDQDPPF